MNPKIGSGFRHLDKNPAMSFSEIGRALGISRGLAFVIYARAIHKLRRSPDSLLKFRELYELAKAKDRANL